MKTEYTTIRIDIARLMKLDKAARVLKLKTTEFLRQIIDGWMEDNEFEIDRIIMENKENQDKALKKYKLSDTIDWIKKRVEDKDYKTVDNWLGSFEEKEESGVRDFKLRLQQWLNEQNKEL